jgi:integrase
LIPSDPTAGIVVKRAATAGHHSWTDQEIEQYRAYWPLGSQQRLVFEFALETASRRGEITRLGPQHIRAGRIHIARSKGSRDVDIPLSAELTAAVAAMPKAHLTFIVGADGKPRTASAVTKDFRKWVAEAGLPPHCRLHGLKKSAMRRLAEAGATAHELMAVSGHKILSEVQRYSDAADKTRLADSAMAKRGRPMSAFTGKKVINIDFKRINEEIAAERLAKATQIVQDAIDLGELTLLKGGQIIETSLLTDQHEVDPCQTLDDQQVLPF